MNQRIDGYTSEVYAKMREPRPPLDYGAAVSLTPEQVAAAYGPDAPTTNDHAREPADE